MPHLIERAVVHIVRHLVRREYRDEWALRVMGVVARWAGMKLSNPVITFDTVVPPDPELDRLIVALVHHLSSHGITASVDRRSFDRRTAVDHPRLGELFAGGANAEAQGAEIVYIMIAPHQLLRGRPLVREYIRRTAETR